MPTSCRMRWCWRGRQRSTANRTKFCISASKQLTGYQRTTPLCAQDAVVLARAVKEHERREGEKLGFSGDEPGDCLAFKHYRDVSIFVNK